MNVLLSIKPKYVDEILAGKKIFEFRKAIFKKNDLGKVFIYSSSPVKKIVASFEIARIIADSPQKLWDKCQKYGGIPQNDFFEYYKNSDIGYAIEITNLETFSEPFDPYKLKKDFRPPQSYCYLPLDYFEKKSYPKTFGKKDEAVILAEKNEESDAEVSAIDENKAHLKKQLLLTKEKVGWIKGVLSDFGQVVSGGTPKTKIIEYWGKDISWISPADLSGYSEKFIYKGRKSITPLGLKNSSAKLMPKGSVLFSSRAPIGYIAIAGNELCTNQGFKSLVTSEAVNSDFLYYYFKSIKQLAEKRASGTTFKELSGKAFSNLPLCLPPLSEQRAIVSKIEQLFSELDNGITNLKLAQAQLKVYRQAVLDKTTKTENIVSIDNVIDELGQGWSPKCHKEPSINDDEWGVIKTTAIQTGYFNEKENKKLPVNLEPRVKHELKRGDILITRAGPRVRVGVCCLVRMVRPKLINCDKAYRIRLKEDLILPVFFEYTLNSPKYTLKIEDLKTGISDSGVNLTQKKFLGLEIPLPSLSEQQAIVTEIETRLSVCDKVEQDIEENLEKAEALRQSILKRAFEGKLLNERELEEVRSAPDWEPAEALLGRIRAEKTNKI